MAQALKIEKAKYDPDTFYLGRETWQVGPRYGLLEYLGAGSFSRVCLALDNQTGLKVALKKIADVGSSADNARKVLRELCILRRLAHPHIVCLHDAFCRPSPTGKLRLVKGQLVSSSIDVYLALEYCEAGDLHQLTGQMTSEQIQQAMWQLTSALAYMHALGVWHRDLKSANILLTVHDGAAIVKIADFGSARAAVKPSRLSPNPSADFDDMDLDALIPAPAAGSHQPSPSEGRLVPKVAGIAMQPTKPSAQQAAAVVQDAGLLTKKVCTPCYRAPEVAIARGKYTAAMDMWSLGCVFGELLQRQERSGTITPKLKIAPVFKMASSGFATCDTPPPDSVFEHDHSSIAKQELQAIFEVIGTPEWACIDNVENARWRNYLWRLPAKAPSFMRRFGFAGEVAIDLLRRLLAFDPRRRCCADEALSHQFFSGLNAAAPHARRPGSPPAANGQQLSSSMLELRLGGTQEKNVLAPEGRRGEAAEAQEPSRRGTPDPKRARTATSPSMPGRGDGPVDEGCTTADLEIERTQSLPCGGGATERRYYEEVEPAAALEALERELQRMMSPASALDTTSPVDAICRLICQEADAEQRRQQALAAGAGGFLEKQARQQQSSTAAFQARWWGRESGCLLDPRGRRAARSASSSGRHDGHSPNGAHGLERDKSGAWPKHDVDDANTVGFLRAVNQPLKLSGTVDVAVGPESMLVPGRHDEWGLHTGHELVAKPGAAWGGGTGASLDPRHEEAIKRQQAR